MRQMKFLGFQKRPLRFGGSELVGKRKDKRPLSFKNPTHLMFKSQTMTKMTSFVKHQNDIHKIIGKTAKQYSVKIYEISINFNHIHNALSVLKS